MADNSRVIQGRILTPKAESATKLQWVLSHNPEANDILASWIRKRVIDHRGLLTMPPKHPNRLPTLFVSLILATVFLCPGHQSRASEPVGDTDREILDLGLEDLLDMDVTSVSKKIQPLSSSPAAIHVISERDIRQSGVTTIPEALRMVPGLQVARIDSNKWAITSRGFNGRFSNKLLVLIDGRSVYSPSFSGVYWEVQDTLLEDIERIEVIRGPGATLWGTNAVNGVINIVTKHSADTAGGLAVVGAGNQEQHMGGLRYGGAIGDNTYARVYVKENQRGASDLQTGGDANDDWSMHRGGLRVDSQLARDSFTLQGDIYRGNVNQTLTLPSLTGPFFQETFIDHVDVSGWHLLTRWKHTVSATSEFELQAYYDYTHRDEIFADETRKTFDLDFQHRILLTDNHDVLWGLHFRNVRDHYAPSFVAPIFPTANSIDSYTGFLQSEIALRDNIALTLGSKIEYLEHTGLEIQPNLRVMWSLSDQHKLWASVSRAVRTPSRAEHDARFLASVIPPLLPEINPLPLPVMVIFAGSENFKPEDLTAFEVGYRLLPGKHFSLDIAAFYNDYSQLRGVRAGEIEIPDSFDQPIIQPYYIDNQYSGATRGYEVSAVWQPQEWWRLDFSYSYIDLTIDGNDQFSETQFGHPPRHQVSLRSTIKLDSNIDLNLWGRYVSNIKASYIGTLPYAIDAYTTLDANVVWRPARNLEIAVVGQNLLDNRHTEFVAEAFIPETEIKRSLHIKVQMAF